MWKMQDQISDTHVKTDRNHVQDSGFFVESCKIRWEP